MTTVQGPSGARRIIGTAGHIDHGKSRLVLALTGTDPDRLPEEKARGITIDLGFAPFRLADGQNAAFVDVPGHERFVRTMVAGAYGIDLALLVIAADEGPMPQTVEHLAILDLLGVERGVVALTKVDLVDDEWRSMVTDEVRALLGPGPLRNAPVVPVSAVTGDGLDALRETLSDVLRGLGPRPSEGPARLPVDRVFTRPGFGTVVTGTLVSGAIARDERLVLYPEGREVRVRGIEVHGEARTRAVAGERTALNLAGLGREEVRRGDVVATAGAVAATRVIAADVRLLPASGPVRSGRTVHLHTGTAQTTARLVWLDADAVDGQTADSPRPARLHVRDALAVQAGDRLIVRAGTPLATVGGGVVLDPRGEGYRRRRTASLEALRSMRQNGPGGQVLAALDRAGGAPRTTAEVSTAAGLAPQAAEDALAALRAAGRVVEPPGGGFMRTEAWQGGERAVMATIAAYHGDHPLRPGVPREELRRQAMPSFDGRRFALAVAAWEAQGKVRTERDRVALSDFQPAQTPEARAQVDAVAERIRAAGVSGVAAEEATAGAADGEEVLALLAARGDVARLGGGIVIGAEALLRARAVLEALLERDGGVGAGAYRDALGVSRRVAVPLLEYFDTVHVTRRQGDLHVAAAGRMPSERPGL